MTSTETTTRAGTRSERAADPLDTSIGDDELYAVPAVARFGEAGFIAAPDLAELAEGLLEDPEIAGYLEEGGVAGWGITYLWKVDDARYAGKCRKLAGELAFFTGSQFLIWLNADTCRDLFALRQVRALLFHELLHVGITDKGAPAILRHDAEVFRNELEVFQLWNANLQNTFGQLELFDGEVE